ncbi:MAG: hypothetical protein WCT51_03450 [Candidatus Shapirobacteria bacterium]
MSERGGGEFLNFKYPELQKSAQVKRLVESKQRKEGIKTPNNPADRNEVYLDRLDVFFNDSNEDIKERKLNLFKRMFIYPDALIDKNNIPDSYFELQLKVARERGQAGDLGHIDKKEAGETIYNDQKQSLDTWIDYLTDNDSIYPSWFKYYTMRNVVKMGAYDKDKKEFGKRSKKTTNIFPDLNREALSFTYDVLEKHYLKHEKHDNEELNRILDSANFSKIYAYAIDKVTPASKENKEKIEGEWTKFNQGDDHIPLYESLQGHGTGWCTAGEETSRIQLIKGDFYVYYSKDQDNKNTIPRIAIRMENGQVAEVRGINADQNLEGNMTDIAKEKYRQLPGGEKFDKKDSDMKFLTLIDKKVKDDQEELSKEELLFIYEINSGIEGFGYKKDPRIKEIIDKRDIKSDISFITGYFKDQISVTKEEALKGGIKFHYGNLKLYNLSSIKGLVLPENINGDFVLSGLKSAEGLILPKSINGGITLSGLESIKGLVLPETINGDLDLFNLESAKGLILPKSINGSLDLSGLKSAEGLVLPKSINGNLKLSGLKSIKGLVLSETINGGLDLSGLKSAEGLVLPKSINGNLILFNLKSAKGLALPKNISGFINLVNMNEEERKIVRINYPNVKLI